MPMMIDAPDRLDLRRAEASDAEACGDILNAWIDARDWMATTKEGLPDVLLEWVRDG
jgi:hypothetical protein